MNETAKISLILVGMIGLGILLAAGCRKTAIDPIVEAGSVFFDIKQVNVVESSDGQIITWLGTHDKDGKSARFGIELLLTTPKKGSPFTFGKGALIHEETSDSSVLLKEVAQALEAKQIPSVNSKTNRLSFATAILGRNLSRGAGKDSLAGSFTSDPQGDWIVVKVFVADGEGELYLNLNSKSGRGEFSIKDPEYGEVVARELAKVL